MKNIDVLLILSFLLLVGNLWFITAFLRLSRNVEAKLRELVAKRR